MNYKNILHGTMSEKAFLQVNRKLMAKFDIQVAALIAYVIDQEKYYSDRGEDEFYISNNDIHLYTGIKVGSIAGVKKECVKEELFTIERKGNPSKSFYYLNHKKILEVVSGDESRKDMAYESKIGEITEETVSSMSKTKLRLVAKKIGVKYSGKDLKHELLNKILDVIKCPKKVGTEGTTENIDLDKCPKKVGTSAKEKRAQVPKKSGRNLKQSEPKTDKDYTYKGKISEDDNMTVENLLIVNKYRPVIKAQILADTGVVASIIRERKKDKIRVNMILEHCNNITTGRKVIGSLVNYLSGKKELPINS